MSMYWCYVQVVYMYITVIFSVASSAFVNNRASHTAGTHSQLAKKQVIGSGVEGGRRHNLLGGDRPTTCRSCLLHSPFQACSKESGLD